MRVFHNIFVLTRSYSDRKRALKWVLLVTVPRTVLDATASVRQDQRKDCVLVLHTHPVGTVVFSPSMIAHALADDEHLPYARDVWREGFPEADWRGVRAVILSAAKDLSARRASPSRSLP